MEPRLETQTGSRREISALRELNCRSTSAPNGIGASSQGRVMASWKFGHFVCAARSSASSGTAGMLVAFCTVSPCAAADRPTPDAPLNHVSRSVAHPVPQLEPPERLVLRVAASQSRIPPWLRPSVAALEIDNARLKVLGRSGGGVLEELPLGPFESVAVHLQPMDPFEGDARIEVVEARAKALRPSAQVAVPTDEGAQVDGVYLSGSVLDETGVAIEGSHVFLAQTNAGTFGYIERSEGVTIISSGPFGSGLPTVSYNLAELPEGAMSPPSWTCSTVGLEETYEAFAASSDGGLAGSPECRQIRVAYDTDSEFLQRFSGSQDAAAGYVATLASALTSIFSRDINARLSVSYVRFWSGNDPWTATTTTSQLTQFKSVWDATMIPVPRDLAHLLSARSLGGGVAYLPGLCTAGQQAGSGAGAYGVSANLDGYFPTPLVDNDAQNWDIFVVAHELGHNFGAPHTHDYSPPVDGCGLSPQDCAAAVADEGTIMSYCHLCAGGMTNIRLRFHPANIATMLARLDAIACDYRGMARPPVVIDDQTATFTAVPVLVDVLANDVEFNCETVSIQSFTPTTFAGGTVTRISAAEPFGRDRLEYTISDPAFAGTDSFTYVLVDGSGQTALGTVDVDVQPLRTPENPIGASPGLGVRYYALASPLALPDFALLQPYSTAAVANLNFASSSGAFADSGRADNVGALFEGWIDVPADGAWTFTLESDEGSRLLIGGEVVVSHDGLHGMSSRSGTIGLAAGRHALRVEYFERTGEAGLILRWQGPSVALDIVPPSALSQGGSDEPADFDNDGIVGASDLSLLLSAWGTMNTTYDLTGDGFVNAQDLAALLFGWAY